MPVVTFEALVWRPALARRARRGAAAQADAAAGGGGAREEWEEWVRRAAAAWGGWLLTNAVLLPFAPLFVEPLRVAGVFDDMREAFPIILRL